MPAQQPIQQRYALLRDVLDERQRRLWAAAEARAYGRGGIARVSEATGLARRTIGLGLRELQELTSGTARPLESGRTRHRGGGRKPATALSPTLVNDLESLLMPVRNGLTSTPLRWTCDSTAKLATLLKKRGHAISPRLVARLLHQRGYSLRASRMSSGSDKHLDRETQFEYINWQVETFQRKGQPVIALTSSRSEDVVKSPAATAPFEAPARSRDDDTSPVEVRATQSRRILRADPDLAGFAVDFVRFWWFHFGQSEFPEAKELLLISDIAGLPGHTAQLWKYGVQGLVRDAGLNIALCHFPPGTSKWTKVELQFESHLETSQGARCQHLQATLQMIGDRATKPHGSAASMERIREKTALRARKSLGSSLLLEPALFHGTWNYVIRAQGAVSVGQPKRPLSFSQPG